MPEYQPLDYTSAFSNVPQPGQAFMQGVQGGFGVQQLQLDQAMKRYQFGRTQNMQSMAAQVAANPTPENIAQLSIAFPEMSEQFKRSYDMLQPQQQRADLQHMSEVHAAMQSDRPDIAAQLLNDRVQALKNAGSPPQMIQAAKAAAQWAVQDPKTFKTASGVMLASIVGPEKYGETFNNLATGAKTVATTPAETAIKKAEADIAPVKVAADVDKTRAETANLAGRLGLDRDKLMSETQVKLREMGLQYGTLQDDQRKIVNDSAEQATASGQSAARLRDLADRMEEADRTTGATGSAYEAIKKGWGAQDGQTALKQEYARIVNNQALGAIKESLGGRVTDVDMKMAMGAVPDANASATAVASYLRGVAKIQQVDAARHEAKAEWLAKGGRQQTLGPAKQDMEIMGTKVPEGTTFTEFSRQFMLQKADQIAAQSALARTQGRSYLRFATPGGGGQAAPIQPAGAAAAPIPGVIPGAVPGAQPGGGVPGAD